MAPYWLGQGGLANGGGGISNFVGIRLTNDLIRGVLKAPLIIHRINYFVKLHRSFKKVSEWEGGSLEERPPLTKSRPIGSAQAKREISNFVAISLTNALIEGILRPRLKFIGLIPLLNFSVI